MLTAFFGDELSQMSIYPRKANANSLLQSAGHNIDKQLDRISGLRLWIIRLFTVDPGNKRNYKGQFLFGCATSDFEKWKID